jgi:hypothetical protein
LVAIEGLMVASRSSPGLFEQGSEGAVHLLVDPGGDGAVVSVFEGAADAVFTAKGLDAKQAGHDGVAAEGGDVGVSGVVR